MSATAVIRSLAARGWISLHQFCTLVDRSYQAVYGAHQRGTIRAVQIQRVQRIYVKELLRIFRESKAYKNEELHSMIYTYIKHNAPQWLADVQAEENDDV